MRLDNISMMFHMNVHYRCIDNNIVPVHWYSEGNTLKVQCDLSVVLCLVSPLFLDRKRIDWVCRMLMGLCCLQHSNWFFVVSRLKHHFSLFSFLYLELQDLDSIEQSLHQIHGMSSLHQPPSTKLFASPSTKSNRELIYMVVQLWWTPNCLAIVGLNGTAVAVECF